MMNDIAKMQELWQEMSSWMTTYMKSFLFARSSKDSKISFGDKIGQNDIF